MTKLQIECPQLLQKITPLNIIRAESSRIQKSGKRYNGFTKQQNILSHKWFKNTTNADHKLWKCSYDWTFNLQDIAKIKNSNKYFRLAKGLVAVSTNTVMWTIQQIIYGCVNGSIKYYTVRETIQPIYGYRNDSIKQHTGRQMVQPNNMQFRVRK